MKDRKTLLSPPIASFVPYLAVCSARAPPRHTDEHRCDPRGGASRSGPCQCSSGEAASHAQRRMAPTAHHCSGEALQSPRRGIRKNLLHEALCLRCRRSQWTRHDTVDERSAWMSSTARRPLRAFLELGKSAKKKKETLKMLLRSFQKRCGTCHGENP